MACRYAWVKARFAEEPQDVVDAVMAAAAAEFAVNEREHAVLTGRVQAQSPEEYARCILLFVSYTIEPR